MKSIRSLLRLDSSRKKLNDGTLVQIQPLKIRQMLTIEGLFTPIAAGFAEKGIRSLEVHAEHADAFIEIVSVAIKKPVEYVEDMSPDDFNHIWSKLLEVDSNFFRALVRQAGANRTQMRTSAGAGPTSSTS